MFFVSSCSCLRSIHWSQVLSWEWRCSWSSADRQCSNYIWVINNFIAYKGATYIRGFTVVWILVTLTEITHHFSAMDLVLIKQICYARWFVTTNHWDWIYFTWSVVALTFISDVETGFGCPKIVPVTGKITELPDFNSRKHPWNAPRALLAKLIFQHSRTYYIPFTQCMYTYRETSNTFSSSVYNLRLTSCNTVTQTVLTKFQHEIPRVYNRPFTQLT